LTIDARIIAGAGYAYAVTAPIALSSNGTWSVDSGGTLTLSGAVSGAVGVTKIGAGTLIASGANSFTGETHVNGGTLVINSVAPIGTSSSIGAGGDEGTSEVPLGPYLFINGGTLRYTGSGHDTNRGQKTGQL
jgi:fibronectin-binding autotransporter adhesin